MPAFVPGTELSRSYYSEVVGPLVTAPHAAAHLGWGSDVLGYDDERSTDHGWGPRVHVFVDAGRLDEVRDAVDRGLPDEFRGRPTRFGWDETPVQHHVVVAHLGTWLAERVGLDPRAGMDTVDWLALPQQLLLEVTRGAVFHDPEGELASVRAAVEWYPPDVWLWLLACQWRRVDQEEPFAGRAAEVGDDLGSTLVTARLARELVRLCFLLERTYAPYSKWLGTAFGRLDAYDEVAPALARALAATAFAAREDALVEAALAVARRHNATGLTREVDAEARLFHDRPFRVLGSGRFVDACLERVDDAWLRSLPLVGGIDQWADSTDVLSDPATARRTRFFYEAARP